MKKQRIKRPVTPVDRLKKKNRLKEGSFTLSIRRKIQFETDDGN